MVVVWTYVRFSLWPLCSRGILPWGLRRTEKGATRKTGCGVDATCAKRASTAFQMASTAASRWERTWAQPRWKGGNQTVQNSVTAQLGLRPGTVSSEKRKGRRLSTFPRAGAPIIGAKPGRRWTLGGSRNPHQPPVPFTPQSTA
jgi:hypothetical protein